MRVLAAILVAISAAMSLAPVSHPRLPYRIGPAADVQRIDRWRGAALALLAVGVWLTIGGLVGIGLGVALAWGAHTLVHRLARRADNHEGLAEQAADVAELLAACLAAGATLERSTAVVADAVDKPAAEILGHVAALMDLGSPAASAWQRIEGLPGLGSIESAVQRSLASGAPLAEALESCAADVRDRRRARVETMAHSVAVAAVGPLGLCFLPAFLLLGVVPIVASLVTSSGLFG